MPDKELRARVRSFCKIERINGRDDKSDFKRMQRKNGTGDHADLRGGRTD